MKLVVAVVRDECAGPLTDNLTRGGFSATKLASTGGFLKAGNSTFLIGVADQRLEEVLETIRRSCPDRLSAAQAPGGRPGQVPVGGATVFVLGVEDLIKV